MKTQGNFKITNINLRPEKSGQDDIGDIGVDINVRREVPRSFLLQIFDLHQIDPLLEGIWSEDGKLQNAGVTTIKLDSEFKGTARIETGLNDNAVLGDVKFCKFSIKPHAGGVCDLAFQIQAHPDAETISDLTAVLGRDANVDIEGESVAPGKKAKTPNEAAQQDAFENQEEAVH